MDDQGKKTRMMLLEQSVTADFIRILEAHHWNTTISKRDMDGEYLIIEAKRAETLHRIAVLYSTAIENKFYKELSQDVEAIFAKNLYHIESYAYGITTPVKESSDFFNILVTWNEALRDGKLAAGGMPRPPPSKRNNIFIQSEHPLDQVWAQLRRLGSVVLATRLVAQRSEGVDANLSAEQTRAKAEGLAYAIRNASDYFRTAPNDNSSQRILNYYYGSLAFAFAEILASPTGPSTLSEIEDMTKQGHGLYTIDGAASNFSTLVTGVLATGFFPRWTSFLGHDISKYPKQKPKTTAQLGAISRTLHASIEELFARIPELHDLYTDIFESPPLWWQPSYDSEANAPAGVKNQQGKTYIRLGDESGRTQLDGVKQLPGPLSEFQHIESPDAGIHFRAVVDHPGRQYWFEPLKIHRSPYVHSALIMPVFEGVGEFRALAFSLLYALSIVVRYRPSLWRRVQEGDWDQYKVLTDAFLDIAERILPEQFLESITGINVTTRQPGAFF